MLLPGPLSATAADTYKHTSSSSRAAATPEPEEKTPKDSGCCEDVQTVQAGWPAEYCVPGGEPAALPENQAEHSSTAQPSQGVHVERPVGADTDNNSATVSC